MPVIYAVLHLLSPCACHCQLLCTVSGIRKTVNQVGLLGSPESAFDSITNAGCCIRPLAICVSVILVMALPLSVASAPYVFVDFHVREKTCDINSTHGQPQQKCGVNLKMELGR